MVSVRLIRANRKSAQCSARQKEFTSRRRADEIAGHEGPALGVEETTMELLAVLLNARGAQAGQAVLVDGILPGQEFLDR
jgi:hypothetical protein